MSVLQCLEVFEHLQEFLFAQRVSESMTLIAFPVYLGVEIAPSASYICLVCWDRPHGLIDETDLIFID